MTDEVAAPQEEYSTPMPASKLGELADEYWQTYTERLAADKVAASLKSKEARLNSVLLAQMRMQGLSAVGGKTVRLSVNNEPDYVPIVEDWEKFYAYILATKDFSLLEKRIGKGAVKERWSLDEIVPGTGKVPVYKLSKSQVKG